MIPRPVSSERAFCGHRFLDPKSILTALIIIALVYCGGLKFGYYAEELIMPCEHRPWHIMGSIERGKFIEWFKGDMEYLTQNTEYIDGNSHDLLRLRKIMRLNEEIQLLHDEISRLQDNPDYTHPTLGFHVYDKEATGWLHVLYKAIAVRENILSSHLDLSAVKGANTNELLDGTPLYEAASGMVPQVEEVVEALEGMALPAVVFHDYKVYILPFSMGEISGLGSRGYMLLGAPPVDCEVMENQTAYTVAHEVGHHVHMTFLGATYEENPSGWDEYMRVRGIPMWTAGGDVNSEGWFESTEETFAEDVRVLFGTQQAASEPHGTTYRDPRVDPVIAENLRLLLTNIPKRAKIQNKGYVSATSR